VLEWHLVWVKGDSLVTYLYVYVMLQSREGRVGGELSSVRSQMSDIHDVMSDDSSGGQMVICDDVTSDGELYLWLLLLN